LKKQTGLLLSSTSFFISTVIIYAARFLTSVIVARSLNVEGKGYYTLVLTVAHMLIMAVNMGINGTLTYFTASQKFSPKVLLGFAIASALSLSILGSAIFLILYKVILSNTLLQGLTLAHTWLVIAVLPVNLMTSFMMSILMGLQQFLPYTLIDISRAVTNLAFQAAASLLILGLPGALGAWVLSNAFAFILTLCILIRYTSPTFRGFRLIFRPSLAYGIKSYIANLTSFFNYRLDTFLVNFYLGRESLGQYTTGVSVAEFLWYLPNAISSVLFPKVSSLQEKTAHLITAQACRITLSTMFPLALIFGVIGSFLIPVIFGEAFRPSVTPFLWLLPGIVALTISKVIAANLSGIGKPQYSTYISTSAIFATLVFDILLIPRMGIAGAAIASSIAYTLISGLSVFWFTRESHLPWRRVLIPSSSDLTFLGSRVLSIASRLASQLRKSSPKV